jgi:hypothetical protein
MIDGCKQNNRAVRQYNSGGGGVVMKGMRIPLAIAVAGLFTAASAVADEVVTPVAEDAATPVCPAFVDADGDGINDNARQGVRNGRGMVKGARGVFVDADGDGINDNAPDDDGDGIPNGQDSDYVRQGAGNGRGAKGVFVDADGDGINDNAPDADGDGIPNGRDADFVRQSQRGRGFVDADLDGINDLAQDSDGDGVINCQDPDYEGPVAAAQGQMRGRRGGMGRRNR